MKIRTGLTTLCALVAFTFASCSLFEKPKQRTNYDDFFNPKPEIPCFKTYLDKETEAMHQVLKIRECIHDKKWFDALEESRRLLKKDPNNQAAIHATAVAYVGLNNVRKAITHYDRLIELYPKFELAAESIDELARQILMKAKESGRQDDAIFSFELFRKDVKTEEAQNILTNWLSNAYFQFGESAYNNEDYETAARYLSRVIDQYPMNCRIWRRLGISYLKIGEPKKAIRIFEHTENHESDKEDLPLLLYARAFSTFDKKKRAELLEKAVKAWPNYRFDFLEEAVESIVSYYRSKRDRKGTLNLINSNLPEPDNPDLDKRTCIHATFFSGIPHFFIYKGISKESYTFYFTQLFNYFRKKKSLANAARALYGRFIFDEDWDNFKKEYATLGDHLRPPKQVKHMLKRFFVWDD